MNDEFLKKCSTWVKSQKDNIKDKYDRLKVEHEKLREELSVMGDTVKQYRQVMESMMNATSEDSDEKSVDNVSVPSVKKRKVEVKPVKINRREISNAKTPFQLCEPTEEEDPSGIGRCIWSAMVKSFREIDGSFITTENIIANGGVNMVDGSKAITMDYIETYLRQSYHNNISTHRRKIRYKQSQTLNWVFILPDWLNQEFY